MTSEIPSFAADVIPRRGAVEDRDASSLSTPDHGGDVLRKSVTAGLKHSLISSLRSCVTDMVVDFAVRLAL